MEVEFAAVVLSRSVPNAEGVIFTAGYEVVCSRMEGKRGYCLCVTLEVAEVRVVMGRQISDCICDEVKRDLRRR